MRSSPVVAGTNASALHYNNLQADHTLGLAPIAQDADAATITLDLSDVTKGKIRGPITLGGNRTLAISNPTAGQSFLLILQQGTGGQTVTWWSGIKWVGATVPTLSTTASRYDIFAFVYDGTNYYGSIVGLNFG